MDNHPCIISLDRRSGGCHTATGASPAGPDHIAACNNCGANSAVDRFRADNMAAHGSADCRHCSGDHRASCSRPDGTNDGIPVFDGSDSQRAGAQVQLTHYAAQAEQQQVEPPEQPGQHNPRHPVRVRCRPPTPNQGTNQQPKTSISAASKNSYLPPIRTTHDALYRGHLLQLMDPYHLNVLQMFFLLVKTKTTRSGIQTATSCVKQALSIAQ